MSDVLGTVLAGGASTRYGSPKALADVGGRRVVDRVASVLAQVVGAERVVAIVNDAELAARIGLPHRSDVLHNAGALAGVHAALTWAVERDARGIIAAACDMPFLEAALLRELLARSADFDVVVPESRGPRGIEPLCAFYGTNCVAPIERAVAAGDARMIGFHAWVRVERVPLAVVSAIGEPDRLFQNLNTPADRVDADRAAAERP